MAWTAPSTFVAGAILTAAQLNTNVRDNTLAGGPIYTTEAARTAAITAPFEGQRAYITGSTETTATGATSGTGMVPTGIQTIYNGTGWVTITSVGAASDSASAAVGTSYTTLLVSGVATSVTLRTGTSALVSFAGRNLATANYYSLNVAVTSSPTVAPQTQGTIITNGYLASFGKTYIYTGLTAGVNTFTLQALANAGTITYDFLSMAVQGIA